MARFSEEAQRRSRKRVWAVWSVAAIEGRSKRVGDRERRERRGKMDNFLSRLQRGISRRQANDEQHQYQQHEHVLGKGEEAVEEGISHAAKAAQVEGASASNQPIGSGGGGACLEERGVGNLTQSSQVRVCDVGHAREVGRGHDDSSIPSNAAGRIPGPDEVASLGGSAGECLDASSRDNGDERLECAREGGGGQAAGIFSAFLASPGVRADGTRIRPTSGAAAAGGRGRVVARNEGGGGEACAIEVPECPMVVAMRERERVRKERRQALNDKYEAKRRAKEEEDAARLAKEEEVALTRPPSADPKAYGAHLADAPASRA